MRILNRKIAAVAATVASALALSSCSVYDLPLPGGPDVGSDPIKVKIQFRDVLDLVPQSTVKVDDVTVGKVTKVELKGYTALVDQKAYGLPITVFIRVRLERHGEAVVKTFEEHVARIDEILDCFLLAGGDDYLLRVIVASLESYEDFIRRRLHDPELTRLGSLLSSSDRPTWLVVAGTSLGTWGVDATRADAILHEHYETATTAGEWTIYRSDDR